MITKNWLENFAAKEAELREMKQHLVEKTKEVLLWEKENLKESYDINDEGVCYRFKVELGKDVVYLHVHSSWSFGGYDDQTYEVPYYKLLTDDWKEKALEEIRIREENARKAKEEAAAKKLEKERKEYERLKAKFENSPTITM